MYDIWPSGSGMEQLFSSLLLNVPNCSFSYAILEVSNYSIVGYVLLVLLAVSHKGIVSKVAIVTVVMLNIHTMTFSKTFECFLGHDCFP